jgi:uncharacterized phiE125 gp8 family phage protein
MMLVEETSVPSSALPVVEFREHLRRGSGFGADSLQDSVLENFMKAAIAAVEARTGKILLTRRFNWTLTQWRDLDAQLLPVAPVGAILAVKLIARTGGETVVEPAAYRLVRDTHRPELVSTTLSLPSIPGGGSAEISLEAGYGAAWSAVPSDLAQAVLLLAAHYYENRSASDLRGGEIPFGVSALIEKYRGFKFGRGIAT